MKKILIGVAALCAWTMPLVASDPLAEDKDAQVKTAAPLSFEEQKEKVVQETLDALFKTNGASSVLVISSEGAREIKNPNAQDGKWLHLKEKPPAPSQQ